MEQQLFKATIQRDNGKVLLNFNVLENVLTIPLTEDKPNDVKEVFNRLIGALKKGSFQFELEDTTEDLYYHISKEYLAQLNVELESVHKELADFDLLITDEAT